MDEFPNPPLSYWLSPANWRPEIGHWLAMHNWRGYCYVHDVGHWRWTHRGCCGQNRARAQVLSDIVQRMMRDGEL